MYGVIMFEIVSDKRFLRKDGMHIVINGVAQSGKDTFIDMFRDSHKNFKVFNTSSIEPYKAVLYELGWNGDKTDKARKFLSDLKKLSIEFNDYPTSYLRNRHGIISNVYTKETVVSFYHIREPEEIKKFVQQCPNTITMLVYRNSVETPNNDSDRNVDDFEYDTILHNDEGLENLKRDSRNFSKILNYFFLK